MAALLREVIGDVLRRARTSQGRTLREVSDSARVSLGYLSEVERGRKEASSELLSAICGALDIPMSRVLSDAGDNMARQECAAFAARRPAPPISTPPRRSSSPKSSRWRWLRPNPRDSILEIGRKGVVICAKPISWQLEQAHEPVPGPADNDTKAE